MSFQEKTFTAVIPVKKNSSRLPGKNLKPFGSENLLTRKIRQVINSGVADKIIVSSDSDEMLEIAVREGVEAILRPEEFANESRPLGEFFDYICTLIPDGNLIWTCVTSPFFDSNLMIEAKEKYNTAIEDGYDSLITIYEFKHYMMSSHGPINFSLGMEHSNSQDLDPLYLFTNGIIIAPIESVKKWHYNYGPNAFRFKVNQKQSIDIDTKLDYLSALSWLEESQ